MQKFKKLLVLTAVLTAFLCMLTVSVRAENPNVNVLIYMIGSDLESANGYATADINEIIEGVQSVPDNVNFIIYGGGTNQWHNTWFSAEDNTIVKIEKTGPIVLCTDGNRNMGESQTLENFLRYVQDNYPSENNILIFWDHGGGALYGFGYDEKCGTDDSLTFPEMKQAIKNAGIRFTLVGFDACLMGTIETVAAMAEHADYVVASEEAENIYGWDYTSWIRNGLANGTVDGELIGRMIVDSYIDKSLASAPDFTSTLTLSKTDPIRSGLLDALNAFSNYCTNLTISDDFSGVSKMMAEARKISYINASDAIDLIYFAEKLDCPEGRELAAVVRDAIVYNRTTEQTEDLHGLSIFFPYKEMKYDEGMEATKQIINGSASEAYGNWLGCFAKFFKRNGQEEVTDPGERTLYDVLTGKTSGFKSQEIAEDAALSDVTEIISKQENTATVADKSDLLESRDAEERQEMNKKVTEYIRENTLNLDVVDVQKNEANEVAITIPKDQLDQVLYVYQRTFIQDGDSVLSLGNICIPFVSEKIQQYMNWNTFNGNWLYLNDQLCPFYMADYSVTPDVEVTIYGYVPVRLNGQLGVFKIKMNRNLVTNELSIAVVFYQNINPDKSMWICDRVAPVSVLQPGDTLEVLASNLTGELDFNSLSTLYTIECTGVAPSLTFREFDEAHQSQVKHIYLVEDVYGEIYDLKTITADSSD